MIGVCTKQSSNRSICAWPVLLHLTRFLGLCPSTEMPFQNKRPLSTRDGVAGARRARQTPISSHGQQLYSVNFVAVDF